MKNKKQKALILLLAGTICLIFSIIIAFTHGTVWVAILFWTSIIINTIGVTFLRQYLKEKKGE